MRRAGRRQPRRGGRVPRLQPVHRAVQRHRARPPRQTGRRAPRLLGRDPAPRQPAGREGRALLQRDPHQAARPRPRADPARRGARRVDDPHDRAPQGAGDRGGDRPPDTLEPGQEPLPLAAPNRLQASHGAAGSIAGPMRAADALMESLKAEGVEDIFGIPGGANLPTYDALVDAGFRHIQVRHEQGGGHAAEGYAKASGKVGVAFATSGPGATNLVTAIADAMMDSVPTVFVTGQVRTELIGTDGFQEADILGATLPFVKHSFQCTDPREIPEYVHEAFHVASTGRPGPVLVDVPQDLSRADIDYAPRTQPVELAGYKPMAKGNIKQVRIAAKALANARRPVIYSGGGVINAEASEE